MKSKTSKKDFFIKIILPTLLAFCLFTISIFSVIIPSFEKNMLEKKREVIKELTNSAWSILSEFNQKVQEGVYTKENAQQEVIQIIEYLRYGDERKDYFWITDMRPYMVVHPYRSELNNTDLSNYKDPEGKKLFVEFVNKVKSNGEGFVDYMWQWKDDSTKIVPKLSFVKEFKPWGWIIGTGIYIEDVKEEIASLTKDLIYISIAILLVLAVLLIFISQQSLKIESKRQTAELGLRESEAKYRTLVEASTEGLVMMLGGEYVYANKTIINMLGYEEDDNINVESILLTGKNINSEGGKYFNNLKNGNLSGRQVEIQLSKKDGSLINVILYASEISFGEKTGYTVIVKDVSVHKKIEEQLGVNEQKYQTLINNINIGLFRIILEQGGKFIEANSSVLNILGYKEKNELLETGLFDLILNKIDQKSLLKRILSDGRINNLIIQMKKKNGEVSIFSISAVLVKDENNEPVFCDGIIEDINDKIKLDEERENLIVELQTSLRFLNEPVEKFIKNAVACNMNLPISKAAKMMTSKKYSAALIVTESNEYVGIVTDHDLRARVIAEGIDLNKPVFEVMSSPIISIQSNSLVFQALLFMNEKSVRHLAVRKNNGDIIGLISSEELLKVHMHSASYILREIETAESVEDIITSKEKLPRLVKTLVDSGAKTKNITQIITSVFDTIVQKLIVLAVNEIGEPPAKFTFVALGSAGRKEQTLISDQDNAIIFEEVPEEKLEHAEKYFSKLASKVCTWLNDCGYVYCTGEAMANNPKWSKPLSEWKKYFHTWITNSDPQDLIDLSIFFDFRSVYGEKELALELRKYLFKIAEGQSGFYQHLAKNCLLHKPPIGLLGNIVVKSKGEHPETFDIKTAVMPIVDYARIYSIKYKMSVTNTIERLHELFNKGHINKTSFEELLQAYNYLMQLRFKHQATQITNNLKVDNYINPDEFTNIEQGTLKNAFTQILSVQKKLNYDFSGEAL
ncbi:MAG: cache domain-containing protein [Bacteroidetes bacterium]|nr:cache domain-containing protein [Bacteroidota bacterium]